WGGDRGSGRDQLSSSGSSHPPAAISALRADASTVHARTLAAAIIHLPTVPAPGRRRVPDRRSRSKARTRAKGAYNALSPGFLQRQLDAGTHPNRRVQFDLAVHLLHQLAANRQPQARTVPSRLRAEERLGDLGLKLLGNSAAVVLDNQALPAAVHLPAPPDDSVSSGAFE